MRSSRSWSYGRRTDMVRLPRGNALPLSPPLYLGGWHASSNDHFATQHRLKRMLATIKRTLKKPLHSFCDPDTIGPRPGITARRRSTVPHVNSIIKLSFCRQRKRKIMAKQVDYRHIVSDCPHKSSQWCKPLPD